MGFILDVTNPEDVRRAEELIAEACPEGLDGLVNNA